MDAITKVAPSRVRELKLWYESYPCTTLIVAPSRVRELKPKLILLITENLRRTLTGA